MNGGQCPPGPSAMLARFCENLCKGGPNFTMQRFCARVTEIVQYFMTRVLSPSV